jgi:hypothetical protein
VTEQVRSDASVPWCAEVMTAVEPSPMLIANARGLARTLLCKDSPERWLHTQGVANRAAELAVTVSANDRPLLIAVAWLHDIGYAPALQETGFHPLDGALYLQMQGWDDRLVALVGHHSGARFVSVERSFASVMTEFNFEDGPVSDALTYAEQTVGPYGRRMTAPHRVVETITRHGLESTQGRVRVEHVHYLVAVADRVEQRLKKGILAAR